MIQVPRRRKDRPILDCMGQFRYNKNNKSLIFGDSTRVNNYGDRGNKLVYFTQSNAVKGDGELHLGTGMQYASIKAAGTLETTLTADSIAPVRARIMAGFDFDFPEALARIIAADIEANLLDLREGVYENSYYNKVLPNFIHNPKDLIEAKKGITAHAIKYPKSYYKKYKLIFSKLNMKYLPEYQSFMTISKQNVLGSFDGKPVNKQIRSYVEIKMPGNEDDRFYIYIKLPNNNFYFFGYQGGVLSTCSNNPQFEQTAEKMKAKEFKFKKGKNEYYVVELVNPLTADLFVKRVNSAVGH